MLVTTFNNKLHNPSQYLRCQTISEIIAHLPDSNPAKSRELSSTHTDSRDDISPTQCFGWGELSGHVSCTLEIISTVCIINQSFSHTSSILKALYLLTC